MNIIAVKSSGRRDGNSNVIIDEILRGALDTGHTSNTLDLNEMNVKGCIGCWACKKGLERCSIDDDLVDYFDQLMEADVLILGIPNYIHGVCGQMKVFIDRHFALKDEDYKTQIPEGKRVIYVFTQGEEDVNRYDRDYQIIVKYLESHGLTTHRYQIYVDDMPAKDVPEVLAEAYHVGKTL